MPETPPTPRAVTCLAVDGVGEVRPGDDLTSLLLDALAADGEVLLEGDVVLVTSKVVSKAEGRQATGDRDAALPAETARVVARRGPTTIARTRHGLVMAAAGIDASNVPGGGVLLLPVDPDASARSLRAALAARTGRRVAVVVTDTSGRAWRHGQTDIAIGAAGLEPLDDHAGRVDVHGHPLAVTAPAVADELAGLGDLVKGKLGGRPFALVRGLGDRVLAVDDDGPGATVLVRDPAQDMFGYGARDAVLAAAGDTVDPDGFGAAVPATSLAAELGRVVGAPTTVVPDDTDGALEVRVHLEPPADPFMLGRIAERLVVALRACGWRPGTPLVDRDGRGVQVGARPTTPG
ncbi:MAG: coenzyme F420-0:L-glutamate ligase [Nocardioides sp.]|nr:coenzyme F420-0:L-glutamate ligase [Nocardioides sp.]